MMRKLALFALFATLILQTSIGFSQEKTKQAPSSGVTVEVDVNLLNVPTTVTDNDGRLVANLEKENWRGTICPSAPRTKSGKYNKSRKKLSERTDCILLNTANSEPQNMPPLRIIVLVDTSKSTEEYLAKFSLPAVGKMLKTLMVKRSEDKYEFYEYSESQKRWVDWSNDASLAEKAFANLYPSGNSAIFDSIYLGAKEFKTTENVTNIIFVVTDGIDNTRRSHLIDPSTGNPCPEAKSGWAVQSNCEKVTTSDLMIALQESKSKLYVIDFSKRYSRDQLTNSLDRLNTQEELGDVAESSGGERILVKDSDEAKRAFEKIADLIGKMYWLGFYTKAHGSYDLYLEVGEEKDGKFVVNKAYTDHASYPRRVYLGTRSQKVQQ